MRVVRLDQDAEQRMRDFYQSLSERDRRRFAGLQARNIGWGGITYVSEVLGCDRKTVSKGIDELLDPPHLEPGRIRKKGRTSMLSC